VVNRDKHAALTIADFSRTNWQRHLESFPGCNGWNLTDWVRNVAWGADEVGAVLESVRCGRRTLDDARAEFGRKIADTFAALDLLATSIDLDLATVVADEFNELSRKVGSPLSFAAAPAAPGKDGA